MEKQKLEEVISFRSDKLRIKNYFYQTVDCVYAAHFMFSSNTDDLSFLFQSQQVRLDRLTDYCLISGSPEV